MGKQLIIKREDISKSKIDLEGRDIIIGFSEPAFRYDLTNQDIQGAPLNARLISYFLPAVEIARMQKGRRPRLFLVSGIKAAVKWNATTEKERKIMVMNSNLKKDYIIKALETFAGDAFSLIEFRETTDFLKIPDETLEKIWIMFRERYPEKIKEIEGYLSKFREKDTKPEMLFKYALSHLFALGDINFDWDVHNPKGYCSVGEHHEIIFNEMRELIFSMLKNEGRALFERDTYFFDNMKIAIDSPERMPPPYNGAHRSNHAKDDLDEVTYENNRDLSYYDSRPRLKPIMDHVYRIISRGEYEIFWRNYKEHYDDLKARYKEAYEV